MSLLGGIYFYVRSFPSETRFHSARKPWETTDPSARILKGSASFPRSAKIYPRVFPIRCHPDPLEDHLDAPRRPLPPLDAQDREAYGAQRPRRVITGRATRLISYLERRCLSERLIITPIISPSSVEGGRAPFPVMSCIMMALDQRDTFMAAPV